MFVVADEVVGVAVIEHRKPPEPLHDIADAVSAPSTTLQVQTNLEGTDHSIGDGLTSELDQLPGQLIGASALDAENHRYQYRKVGSQVPAYPSRNPVKPVGA